MIFEHRIFGTISGDDANSDVLAFRKYRFQANLAEANLMFEWKVFGKLRYNEVGMFIPSITPYIFAGVGYTLADKTTECYHPECLNNGINPFPEPGDRNTFITMPIGIGVKWDFYEYISLGAEWGWRNAFSDYLDGVSIYGKPGNNDWYFSQVLRFHSFLEMEAMTSILPKRQIIPDDTNESTGPDSIFLRKSRIDRKLVGNDKLCPLFPISSWLISSDDFSYDKYLVGYYSFDYCDAR
ncbi:MAG: DUF6089 family protein [Saprospiraceae bacterium]